MGQKQSLKEQTEFSAGATDKSTAWLLWELAGAAWFSG
jgi:hypothetical protein